MTGCEMSFMKKLTCSSGNSSATQYKNKEIISEF